MIDKYIKIKGVYSMVQEFYNFLNIVCKYR